jgi:type IV pilus assembly protein PilQ
MRLFLLVGLLSLSSASAAAPLKISLEVQKADIHSLLRFFGEVGKVNFIAGDDVSGQVTVRLRHVSVQDAIDAVLATRGLGQERMGNIVRVAPLATLAAEAKARADLKEAQQRSAELQTTLIPINYARATDIAKAVRGSLSPRGSVTVDERTNTLIVRDVP